MVAAPPPAVLCTWDDERLDEVSAMAVSRRDPRLLWVMEDSGNGPWLTALTLPTATGGRCESKARVKILGISARDIEAMAVGVDAEGRDVVWIADIGDNNAVHDNARIDAIAEPRNPTGTLSVDPLITLRFKYFGGPRDAESIIADPKAARLWVVSKQLVGGDVFALPEIGTRGWRSGAGDLPVVKAVAEVGGLTTDAAAAPDSSATAIRDYGAVSIFQGLPTPEGLGRPVATLDLPLQTQGEAITWNADASALLVASERENAVWTVPIPTAQATPSASTTPGAPSSEPSLTSPTASDSALSQATTDPSPVASSPIAGLSQTQRITIAVGAAVAAILLLVTSLLVGRRRR